jgi:hypothetical protein
LFAHGRWFFPGTPASSTTKTGRHDIAEILLKMALHIKNQSKSVIKYTCITTRMKSDSLPGNGIQIIMNNNENLNQDKETINYFAFQTFDFGHI